MVTLRGMAKEVFRVWEVTFSGSVGVVRVTGNDMVDRDRGRDLDTDEGDGQILHSQRE